MLTSATHSTRPSPWWVLGPTTLLATASGATTFSAMNLYSDIICWSHGYPDTDSCNRESLFKVFAVLYFGVTLSATLLSWVTASWIGSLSDRYGRTRILTLAAIGSLIADLSVIVAHRVASSRVPHIYLLVVAGAIIQGGLGGLVGITAINRAYLVDTTTESNRASFLSVHLGLNSLGVIFGMILNKSELVSTTTTVGAHYVLAGTHAAYALYLLNIVPDSLTVEEKRQRQATCSSIRNDDTHWLQTVKRNVSLFVPFASIGFPGARASQNVPRPKDWSFTLIIIAFLLTSFSASGFDRRANSSLGYEWSSLPLVDIYFYYLGTIVFAFVVLFPALKRAGVPKRTKITCDNEGSQSIARDFEIGRVSATVLLASFAFMSLSPYSLPLTTPILIGGVLGVVFRPALMSVIVSTYETRGGEQYGRLLGGLGALEDISTISGTSFFGYAVASEPVLIPVALLAALYYCLLDVGVPEICTNTTKSHPEDEERLVRAD